MSSETVATIVLLVAAIAVVMIGLFATLFGLFICCRVLIKVTNVGLVLTQFGTVVRGVVAPATRAEQQQPATRGLPTKARMASTPDEELEAAVRYYDSDGEEEELPPEGDPADEGRVQTMDQHAGFDSDEPPVKGQPIVGR